MTEYPLNYKLELLFVSICFLYEICSVSVVTIFDVIASGVVYIE